MGIWSIVIPEETTNFCYNPSGESTGNYAASGAATVTRVTSSQKFGLYSYRIQASISTGIDLTLSPLADSVHYVSVLLKGNVPGGLVFNLTGGVSIVPTYVYPTLIEQIDSDWAIWGGQFPAVNAVGATNLIILQNGSGSGDFYIDAIQVEAKEYPTTYCDGTQEGCIWNGLDNASTSTRSELSRAGGRVYDFDDLGFFIEKETGMGMASIRLNIDEFSSLPGGELNSIDTPTRVFTLIGMITDEDSGLYSKRLSLVDILSPDDYEGQPVLIRFRGTTIHKEIKAHYESGLEADIEAPGCFEKVAVRFLAESPYFTEIGNSAKQLAYEDSATVKLVAGRLKSTGHWNPLGPPITGAGFTEGRCLVEDKVYLYLGGTFQNFDGQAACDYLARYNKQTALWSPMSTGANGSVVSMLMAPNGYIYISGEFTTIGGTAANKIAVWNGSSFSALGSGLSNPAYKMAIDPTTGYLICVGVFTTAGGSSANRIAYWDGSSWGTYGTGGNGAIYAVTVDNDGTLYIGGALTSIDSVSVNYIAKYQNGTWSPLAGGMNTTVFDLLIDNDDLYAVGNFTSPGNYVARWNGTEWFTLSSGLNALAHSLAKSPDGDIYIGGNFTTAGGINLADRVTRWNGSSFAHLDINLPGTPDVRGLVPSKFTDSEGRYDLWLGFSTVGTATFNGINTVTNSNTKAYPAIVITRSGGTSAVIERISNETNRQELLLDYSLQDGETLTINLDPQNKNIVSSYFGSRPDAILANSDFGSWNLRPGSNRIGCFINASGSPTITPIVQWKKNYKSVD